LKDCIGPISVIRLIQYTVLELAYPNNLTGLVNQKLKIQSLTIARRKFSRFKAIS